MCPHGARCRGKDQCTVPLLPRRADQPLSSLHGLPGHHQHRAAGQVGLGDHTGAPGAQAVQGPGRNGGLGHCSGGADFQPPFGKIETGPGKLAAFQQGILPGGALGFGGGSPWGEVCLPQYGKGPGGLSAGEGAGVHGPDELLAPQQQRNKQRQPGPQPGAAQQRTQPKKQPQTLFYPQTHMPLPGQSGQRAVMPGGTARPESAGQRYNAGQVQPCLCGMAQQGVGAAALRGEFYRSPETNGFHDGLLSGRCPVGRCPVAVCSVV